RRPAAPVEAGLETHPRLTPRVAELALVVVPAGCALPLDLGRKPLAGPVRERLGLVERDVLNRFPWRDRLAPPEPKPPPAVSGPLPVERRVDVLALAPGPALVAPELSRVVAAVVDERRELAARHGRPVDAEGRMLRLVRLELVVVRPGLVDGAHRER